MSGELRYQEMREVHVQVLPHMLQRYPTVGDWEKLTEGEWLVKVSEMGDWRYHFLVMLHELIEMALCTHQGITEQQVTAFDESFEVNRSLGDTSEPGDSPDCPYRLSHQFSEVIERAVASRLGVSWGDYDNAVSSL